MSSKTYEDYVLDKAGSTDAGFVASVIDGEVFKVFTDDIGDGGGGGGDLPYATESTPGKVVLGDEAKAVAGTNDTDPIHSKAAAAAIDAKLAPVITSLSRGESIAAWGATHGTDSTTAIQDAHDAVEANGGGELWLPSGEYDVTGLEFAGFVSWRGEGGGSQVGNPTKLIYTGSSGGTVLTPKYPSTDQLNVGMSGFDIDGGISADICLSLYRTSYSAIRDMSIYAMSATGVGVLLDANVSNKCYFNVVDNVKVDVYPGATGVRFQRGANVNRWEGGKVSNGAVGFEFLSLSAGNYIAAVDCEDATSKHVYIDAPANVFIGMHMESAPIGYDITANGSGTRRFATTFASTVTTYVADLSAGGTVFEEVADEAWMMQLGTTTLKSTYGSGTLVQVESPRPASTGNVLFQFLRNTVTSGLRRFTFYKGDGTSAPAFIVDCADASVLVGSVSLGGGVGVVGIANRTTAPASNPTGGGVLYCQSGALMFKGSSGTVTTVAPA